MEVSSCSMRVEKSTKVELSEGGIIQMDFLLKGGDLSWMLLRKKYCYWQAIVTSPSKQGCYALECCCEKKYCFSMPVLNLFLDLFFYWLEVLVGHSQLMSGCRGYLSSFCCTGSCMFWWIWSWIFGMKFALVLLEDDFYWWWCIYAF